MTWTDPNRWTCPNPACGRTVVVNGSAEDTAWAIRCVMERHGKEHAAARKLEARLRKLPVTGSARLSA